MKRSSTEFKKTKYFKNGASELGRRLREIRRAQKLTLDQLAERSMCDAPQIQKYERGKGNITLASLLRLSIGLRQPVATFFGGHILTRPEPIPEDIHVVYAELDPDRPAAKTPTRPGKR